MTTAKKVYRTNDGARIYDLDPQAAELWAVAGPDDLAIEAIDTDDLPQGVRWVTDEEWQQAMARGPQV